MKIAFSSTEGTVVDQHFGSAECFYLWDVGPEQAECLGSVAAGATGEDQEDRIVARANALRGCAVVFTAQIGGPAAAKLVARRIHPVKAPVETPIVSLIENLQRVLRGRPPPWLRKAMGLPVDDSDFVPVSDQE